jgi:hypothetical protein
MSKEINYIDDVKHTLLGLRKGILSEGECALLDEVIGSACQCEKYGAMVAHLRDLIQRAIDCELGGDYESSPSNVSLLEHALASTPKHIGHELLELREIKNLITIIYNRGYLSGHDKTVEGCYVDVVESDMESHHNEIVRDIIIEETGRDLM